MRKLLNLATAFLIGLTLSALASAGAITDYGENKLIDAMMRGQALGAPASWHAGLDTAACNEAGGGTEVTGGSYARVAIPATLAGWAGTQAAGSTTASTGTGAITSNNGLITFPTPTADWGQVVSFRLWDAATGGNAWLCQTLVLPKTVNNGDDPPKFNAGSLTIQIDN